MWKRLHSSSSTSTRAGSAPRSTSDTGQSNILRLPREVRDNIYRMVFYVAHPLYLFQDTDSQIEVFGPERPPQWLALLHVNRQIHAEAAESLFGTVHFVLLDEKRAQGCLLKAFLTRIGPANSASLSHLSMDFPNLEGTMEELKMRDDSLQRFQSLQESCTNLTTLEISFSARHSRDLNRLAGESLPLIKEALSQINSQLQVVPSLQNIVVRVTAPNPAVSIMDCMRSLGWNVVPASGA